MKINNLEKTHDSVKNNYTKVISSEDIVHRASAYDSKHIIDTEEVIRINENDWRPDIKWSNKSILLDIAEQSENNAKINLSEFMEMKFEKAVPNLSIDIVHYLSNLKLFSNPNQVSMKRIHWENSTIQK